MLEIRICSLVVLSVLGGTATRGGDYVIGVHTADRSASGQSPH